MKKILNVLVILVISNMTFSQTKWKIGVNYSFGFSTLYGNSVNNNSSNGTNLTLDYSLKTSLGTGFKIERKISDKLNLVGSISYIQKGASFDASNSSTKPSFKLNYIDFNLGIKRYFSSNENWFAGLNIVESTLLSSYRMDIYGGSNLSKDIKKMDYGFNLNLGRDFKTKRDDFIQINLFFTQGFNQLFQGAISKNGIQGRNMIGGIQLGYLIGK
jgi:hypothetical protein